VSVFWDFWGAWKHKEGLNRNFPFHLQGLKAQPIFMVRPTMNPARSPSVTMVVIVAIFEGEFREHKQYRES
jgi:hypothetical protein